MVCAVRYDGTALRVEGSISGHTSSPFRLGSSVLEDIPEHLPGGRYSAEPTVRQQMVSVGEFTAYRMQLSPQTESHVCELLRCFPRVMGAMGVGMGEEVRPGRPPGGGGTLVQPYRLRSDCRRNCGMRCIGLGSAQCPGTSK